MSHPDPQAQHCMVCATPLSYHSVSQALRCHYCGEAGNSPICCPQGHFVCDACHGRQTLELLALLTEQIQATTPEAALEELFALPRLPMHGPEHHPMAALALLLAARNQGHAVTDEQLREAIRRGMQIPGGACGYLGSCGAGPSLGIALSLLTEATPLKGRERALANRSTAAALTALADDQPRCCKRALRQAVRVGRSFLAEHLDLHFPPQPEAPLPCRDAYRNRECPGAGCAFSPRGTSAD